MAALALVFVGSFWDAILRAHQSSPTIAVEIPELQVVTTRASVFAERVASPELHDDAVIDTAGSKNATQIQQGSEEPTLSGLPEVWVASAPLRATRSNAASRTHTPIANAKDRRRAKVHIIQTTRGQWLWPLNPNGGPNG
jgi:hypothetical protein